MVIYRSFYDAIIDLPEQNQIEVWNAIFLFGFDGVEQNLTGISKMLFTLIKPQLEANNRKAEIGKANGEKGAKFGKLGGRPAKEKPANNPQETPIEGLQITPTKPPNVNDNVNENKNVNENDNVLVQIPPPQKNETAWWKKATRQDIEKKIEPYINSYPASFITEFVDYYSLPNEDGGININQLRSFEIESHLRKWWSDPKTKTKHTTNTQRLPDEITSKPNEELAERIERAKRYVFARQNTEQGD